MKCGFFLYFFFCLRVTEGKKKDGDGGGVAASSPSPQAASDASDEYAIVERHKPGINCILQ